MKSLPQHYLQALAFALTSPASDARQLFLEKLYVFVSYAGNERMRTEGRVYLEVYEKLPGGVSFANGWLKENREEVHEFLLNLAQSGLTHVSPRPYRLGQACDGTIGSSVLHAFKVACDALGLNADELHRKAYATEEVPDWVEAQLHAEWQGGVDWPKSWDAKAIEGLADSLTEINYHRLREEFETAVATRTAPLAADAAATTTSQGADRDLATALTDLTAAIEGITLGSIEEVVLTAAGEELIRNWNDHDPRHRIDEAAELERWRNARA